MKGRPDPPPTLIARQLGSRACGTGTFRDDGALTALYLLYGSRATLLYVGVTGNLLARMRKHATSSPWWPEVKGGCATWYRNRVEAESEERWAIIDFNPKYNVHGRVIYIPPAWGDNVTVPAAARRPWGQRQAEIS